MEDIHELRVAVTAKNFDATTAFYRNEVGLVVESAWERPDGRGLIFGIPRATLAVVDETQAESIDQAEVGRRVSGPIRLALGVRDVDAIAARIEKGGTPVLGNPRTAPWGHRVARVEAPDRIQLTLFSEPTLD